MTEITLAMMLGRKRLVIDCRNGIPESTPGDKAFYTPEYSPDFHKLSSARTLNHFGISRRLKKITTVTLQKKPGVPSIPYSVKWKMHQLEEEKLSVINLEQWKPAPPLVFTKRTRESENL
ncbi:spermatogenesis-associated serine-rich protein 1 [Callorhinchus milii]|uniref:spermatogenesis-associated serine-rich protein 1 n=1 Tax=Callorhinchus milii TaxID=7868 RepID=UPI0004572E85|nr:spermatogenesis-associated serine-rich protein 1 [Callorhinchus milii]|eukprot:gi/632970180/ref/XP_007901502.1/ PREDICTED: spermatogenesis-associated serine-rich protein 1 [Callorhinchus milii]